MRIPKFILIIFLVLLLGLIGYIFVLKKSKNTLTPEQSTSSVEVIKGILTDSISVTGNASLANEQKLKFGQTGKIAEVFVKVGDSVKEGDVLASLDKRSFFQEMAQAQNALEKIDRNISEEKKKATGPEARQLERSIESMERKLEEMQEDFEKAVQNSPGKNQEKLLDINEKKRDLELQKQKYDIEFVSYEKEEKNQKALIEAKIRDGRKMIDDTLKNSSVELAEMRRIHNAINQIFGFDTEDMTFEEIEKTANIGQSNYTHDRYNVQNLWQNVGFFIEDHTRFIDRIDKNSKNITDAQKMIQSSIAIYTKLWEALNIARSAAEKTQIINKAILTKNDIDKSVSELSSHYIAVQSKISQLRTNQESLLLIDSPEKIKEKFLFDLKNKKIALEKMQDAIKRGEIQITQEEKGITIIGNNRVENSALKREIADKQSAIQDQKDAILTKKEELEKMRSGKSDALENLLTSRKNQLSEIEKLKTREESYEIRAPFSGTIRSIKMQVGDVLGANSSGNTEEEKSILLENSDVIHIKVALNQLDIIKVSLGQLANISFEAVPGAMLEGKITEISSTPSAGNGGWGPGFGGGGLSTYDIIITAERKDHPIYSGMNAMITIPLDASTEALLVPLTAVNEDVNSGEQYVNVIEENGNIRRTVVETGRTNKSQIEILSGLSEWQNVQIIDFNANTFTSDDFSPSYGF